MNLLLVNDHVFFPHVYRGKARFSRGWMTDVQVAVSGKESRESMRATAKRRLSYNVDPLSLSEWALLEARIMQAMKSGKACCPFWGRGVQLAADVSSLTVQVPASSMWPWAAGDWIFFRHPNAGEEGWNLRQIASVNGTNLALTQAVTHTFKQGTFAWPVLFGTLTINDFETLTTRRAPVRVTIGDPIEVSPEPSMVCGDGSGGGVGSGPLSPVLLEVAQDTCGNTALLRWPAATNATSYRIYESIGTHAGPFNLVVELTREQALIDAQTGALGYEVVRPLIRGNYYKARACRGNLLSELSDAVEVPAITIEKTCAALQERYRLGKALPVIDAASEDWIPWLARLSDGQVPSEYPATGFYNADLLDGGGAIVAANLQRLVQMLMDSFYGGWLSNYATSSVFQHVADIPVHSEATLPPIEVTTENAEACLRTINTRLCALQNIVVPATQTNLSAKSGFCYVGSWSNYTGVESDPFPDSFTKCIACAREALFGVAWGKSRIVGGYNFDRFIGGLDCNDGLSIESDDPVSSDIGHYHLSRWRYFPEYSPGSIDRFGYEAGTNAVRGYVTANLSVFPTSASAKLYYYIAAGAWTVSGVTYPQDKWSQAEDVAAPSCGGVWATEKYVLNSGKPDVARTISQWELEDQIVLVVMSADDWSYLP